MNDPVELAAALTSNSRFDVVIWNFDERKVVSITGKNLRYAGKHQSAETRLETTLGRINLETHTAEIVPHGMYEIGDRIA